MEDGAGFEPAEDGDVLGDLANRRHKPLGHPSVWGRGGDSHPCHLHGTQKFLLLNYRDKWSPAQESNLVRPI
jgi:hypothetical protein